MYGYKVKNNETDEIGFIATHEPEFAKEDLDAKVIVVYTEPEVRAEVVWLSQLTLKPDTKDGDRAVLSLVPSGPDDNETIN